MSIYHFCRYHGLCKNDAMRVTDTLREHMTGDLEQWLNDAEFFVEFRQDIIDEFQPDDLTIHILDLMLVSTMQPLYIRQLQFMKGEG